MIQPLVCNFRDHLVRARQRTEDCFLLLEGVLIQEQVLDKDHRQIVGLHVPGDVCGLTAFSSGYVDHSLIALSPVSCLPIKRHWLSSFAQESPDLSHAVWREMAREAAISAAWIVNIGQRSAYRRLAHFMCEFAARLHAAGLATGAGFDWPGTQSDLAAANGMSLVHVNKTLRRLEADRLVSCGRRTKWHDLAKLGSVANFDPSYLALDRETLGKMLMSRVGLAGRDETASAPRSASRAGPTARPPSSSATAVCLRS